MKASHSRVGRVCTACTVRKTGADEKWVQAQQGSSSGEMCSTTAGEGRARAQERHHACHPCGRACMGNPLPASCRQARARQEQAAQPKGLAKLGCPQLCCHNISGVMAGLAPLPAHAWPAPLLLSTDLTVTVRSRPRALPAMPRPTGGTAETPGGVGQGARNELLRGAGGRQPTFPPPPKPPAPRSGAKVWTWRRRWRAWRTCCLAFTCAPKKLIACNPMTNGPGRLCHTARGAGHEWRGGRACF